MGFNTPAPRILAPAAAAIRAARSGHGLDRPSPSTEPGLLTLSWPISTSSIPPSGLSMTTPMPGTGPGLALTLSVSVSYTASRGAYGSVPPSKCLPLMGFSTEFTDLSVLSQLIFATDTPMELRIAPSECRSMLSAVNTKASKADRLNPNTEDRESTYT